MNIEYAKGEIVSDGQVSRLNLALLFDEFDAGKQPNYLDAPFTDIAHLLRGLYSAFEQSAHFPEMHILIKEQHPRTKVRLVYCSPTDYVGQASNEQPSINQRLSSLEISIEDTDLVRVQGILNYVSSLSYVDAAPIAELTQQAQRKKKRFSNTTE